MDDRIELIERWSAQSWKDAIQTLIDPSCSKEDFDAALKRLYPNGDHVSVSTTHRGRAELIDFRGVNLSSLDLTGVDFYKLDLAFSNFSNANITNAHFATARLDGANFANCYALGQVDFSGCFARKCNFHKAKLTGAIFAGSDLTAADLSEAVLQHCDLSFAIAIGSDLSTANLIDCDVRGLKVFEKERAGKWLRSWLA